MADKPVLHYNMDDLISENADFNLLYGERSNGKSYQLKTKIMLSDEVINGDEQFILVRRFKDEIKTASVEWYFNDMDISRITDGQYDCIDLYRREIFLCKYDRNKHKKIRGKKIGYAVPLEDEQDYAGGSFLKVKHIIFEEFMSRSRYLYQEPDKLMNLYCTVDRKKGTTKVWMCGNTISRVCPYLTDWDLMDIMRTQEQGTIVSRMIPVDDEGTEVKMSIEYCQDTGRTSFTFGQHAGMLNSGSWQADRQPHLPKSVKAYDPVFRCVFSYKQFTFLASYLQNPETGDRVWFVNEKKTPIKDGTFVISDQISPDRKWFRDPYTVKSRNRYIMDIFSDFRESKIFYATDLQGTDFKQAIDFTIRK